MSEMSKCDELEPPEMSKRERHEAHTKWRRMDMVYKMMQLTGKHSARHMDEFEKWIKTGEGKTPDEQV